MREHNDTLILSKLKNKQDRTRKFQNKNRSKPDRPVAYNIEDFIKMSLFTII